MLVVNMVNNYYVNINLLQIYIYIYVCMYISYMNDSFSNTTKCNGELFPGKNSPMHLVALVSITKPK